MMLRREYKAVLIIFVCGWLLSVPLLLSARSGPTELTSATEALHRGNYKKTLRLLAEHGQLSARWFYLRALAREGLDSIYTAKEDWIKYLAAVDTMTVGQAYHRAVGEYCLGTNYILQDRYELANQYLEPLTHTPAGQLPDTMMAKVWNSYGVARSRTGNDAAAGAAFRRAIMVWERAGKSERALLPRYSAALHLAGTDARAAALEFERLLHLPAVAMDNLHPAMPALALCDAWLRFGDPAAARTAFHRVEERIARYPSRRFTHHGHYEAVRGLLLQAEGRGSEARGVFASSGSMSNLLPPHLRGYYQGLSLQLVGQYDGALEMYVESLDEVPAGDAWLRGKLNQLLAECLLQSEQVTLAEERLRAATTWFEGFPLELKRTTLLRAEVQIVRRDTVAALRELNGVVVGEAEITTGLRLRLTDLLQRADRYEEAEAFLEGMLRNSSGLNQLARAQVRGRLSKQRWRAGQFAPAEAFARAGVDELLTHWSALRGVEGLRLQRHYFDELFRLGVSTALRRGDPLAAISFSELFNSLELSGQLLDGGYATLAEHEAELRRQLPASLEEKLAANQSLVYYLQGIDSLFAVVFEPGIRPRTVPLRPFEGLAGEVISYRKFLSSPRMNEEIDEALAQTLYTFNCEQSHRLYRQLIEPLRLEASDFTYIIPTETLNLLPFASLLTTLPDRPKFYDRHSYLLRQRTISYLPALALLYRPEAADLTAGTYPIRAFAPYYGPQSSLPLLLNNEREVDRLGEAFRGTYYTGGSATKDKMFLPGGKPHLLHLSMHAVFDPVWPDSSWLAFAGEEKLGTAAWCYTADIATLFPRHPFVFLSACQTANGKLYGGQGALSITRAMMARGNPRLVSSLWDVDDKKVGELIGWFYANLSAGQSTAEALRTAQLAYLDDVGYRDAFPYYWSGLSHFGVEALVRPQKRGVPWWWVLIIITAAASVGSGLFNLYRHKQRQAENVG